MMAASLARVATHALLVASALSSPTARGAPSLIASTDVTTSRGPNSNVSIAATALDHHCSFALGDKFVELGVASCDSCTFDTMTTSSAVKDTGLLLDPLFAVTCDTESEPIPWSATRCSLDQWSKSRRANGKAANTTWCDDPSITCADTAMYASCAKCIDNTRPSGYCCAGSIDGGDGLQYDDVVCGLDKVLHDFMNEFVFPHGVKDYIKFIQCSASQPSTCEVVPSMTKKTAPGGQCSESSTCAGELTWCCEGKCSNDPCPYDFGIACFAKDRTKACRLHSRGVSPDDAYDACFQQGGKAGDASLVLLAELAAGDLILSSAKSASRVVATHHAAADILTDVLTFHTEEGTVSMTAGHAVFVDGTLAAASDVRVGSILSSGVVKRVTKSSAPIINPVTIDGTILVADSGAPTLATTYGSLPIARITLGSTVARVLVNAGMYAAGDVDSVAGGLLRVLGTLAATIALVQLASVAVRSKPTPRPWSCCRTLAR